MWIAYLIIAFITFFFLYKKREMEIKYEKERADLVLFETPILNTTVFLSIFRIISIPLMILWRILEKISRKFNLFNNQ